jgi:uncharacterized tellurite resistance protein B-like protein
MIIHSSFADFVLFLYVHVAHLDHTYDPSEISVIKSKMPALFPAGTDLETKLYQMIREYNRFDKSKLNELCRETVLHFKDDAVTARSRLYHDFRDIIMADGEVHDLETRMLDKIRRITENKK